MAEPDERGCHSIATVTLTLDTAYPAGMWEIIEDKIADALTDLCIAGSLENSVTGNSVSFRKDEL